MYCDGWQYVAGCLMEHHWACLHSEIPLFLVGSPDKVYVPAGGRGSRRRDQPQIMTCLDKASHMPSNFFHTTRVCFGRGHPWSDSRTDPRCGLSSLIICLNNKCLTVCSSDFDVFNIYIAGSPYNRTAAHRFLAGSGQKQVEVKLNQFSTCPRPS